MIKINTNISDMIESVYTNNNIDIPSESINVAFGKDTCVLIEKCVDISRVLFDKVAIKRVTDEETERDLKIVRAMVYLRVPDVYDFTELIGKEYVIASFCGIKGLVHEVVTLNARDKVCKAISVEIILNANSLDYVSAMKKNKISFQLNRGRHFSGELTLYHMYTGINHKRLESKILSINTNREIARFGKNAIPYNSRVKTFIKLDTNKSLLSLRNSEFLNYFTTYNPIIDIDSIYYMEYMGINGGISDNGRVVEVDNDYNYVDLHVVNKNFVLIPDKNEITKTSNIERFNLSGEII